jgi:uroporphyrinogen decarboxylase
MGRHCRLDARALRPGGKAFAGSAMKVAEGGPGAGFILSDNHGEIPWQVPDETLLAISDAVHKWGKYPLQWLEEHDRQ